MLPSFMNARNTKLSNHVLHILYMKSNSKALSRNYNAEELELLCQNRFYGPIVVALNVDKPPFYITSFTSADYRLIQTVN